MTMDKDFVINSGSKLISELQKLGKLGMRKSLDPALKCKLPILKHEWPFYEPLKSTPKFWKLRSTAIIYMAGLLGKFLVNVLNRPVVYNKAILTDLIFNRPRGKSLITVSNHESCIDDPPLFQTFMTQKQLLDRDSFRWTLVAHDICFTRPLHSFIFSNGKGVPVVRGLGVYQKSLDFAIERLKEGDWVHIFPEGKINLERREMLRLKWGIGRIISELPSSNPPIVLPFWHSGMSDLYPNKRPFYPRIGKNVIVNIGQPIDLKSTLELCKGLSPMEKRKLITDKIQAELELLRLKTLQIVKREKLAN